MHTVEVYDLRMCMSENNPGLNYSREIISSAVQGILCEFTPSSSLFCPTCLQWPPIEKHMKVFDAIWSFEAGFNNHSMEIG